MKACKVIEAIHDSYESSEEIFIIIFDETTIMALAREEELPLNENEAENIILRLEKAYEMSAWELDITRDRIKKEIEDYLRGE